MNDKVDDVGLCRTSSSGLRLAIDGSAQKPLKVEDSFCTSVDIFASSWNTLDWFGFLKSSAEKIHLLSSFFTN